MPVTETIAYRTDLDSGVRLTRLGQLFATSDHLAHTVRTAVVSSGRPVDLSGAGVIAYFMRADEQTVVVTGEAAGDTATVTLPEACYAVPGRFQLIVKATLDGERKAIFWGDGCVTRASTDEIVDPGDVVPSLEELLARIGEMEAATAAAKTATENANAATEAAKQAKTDADEATEAANQAKRDADEAREALTDQWDDVSLEYELLPPSADPWAKLEQTAHETKFLFGLPHSNLAYSTFEVDDEMNLVMTAPDGFSDITFTLQDDGCIYLEVA